MSEDTKEKKVDYLEVDDPIAGQNYVCLSFISPESFIQNKDAFKCVKFLQSYCKEQKLKFEEVYSKYQDFTYKYEDKLQRDFDEQNDFQTSIRGLKVRGVFDTKEAANDRAKKLSLRDCLKMEYQLSQHIVYRSDFNEGVYDCLIGDHTNCDSIGCTNIKNSESYQQKINCECQKHQFGCFTSGEFEEDKNEESCTGDDDKWKKIWFS